MLRLCQMMPMCCSNITFRSIIVDQHATFVPNDANVLFKVVAIFGVINRVPATAPAHSVFCYSAVAHIETRSETLAFRPKSGFKNKCRARAGFGLVISVSDHSRLQNEALLQLVWICRRGQQGEIVRIHPPSTNSKNRLKSFREVGYANFRPNDVAAGKWISMEILVGMGLHA